MTDLWTLLGTNSRRALRRKTVRFGRTYTYKPRGDLLRRLAEQTDLSTDEVYQKLIELRRDLLLRG